MIHIKDNLTAAVFVVVSLFAVPLMSADSFWEGSITTAAYGTLPENGMYGASNAFPLNSKVVVSNPRNGKQIEVVITKRLDNPAIFLALSGSAGAELGISRGSIVNGTVLLPSSVSTGESGNSDEVLSQDPEVNPSAGGSGKDGELALIEDYINKELGGKSPEAVVSDKPVEPVLPEKEPAAAAPAEETPAAAKTAGKAEPSSEPEAETAVPEPDVPRLSELPGAAPPAAVVPPITAPLPEMAAEKENVSDVPAVVEFEKGETAVTEERTFRADTLPELTEADIETPEVINLIATPKEKTFTSPRVVIPDLSSEKVSGKEDLPDMVALAEAPAVKEKSAEIEIASPEIKKEAAPETVAEKPAEKTAEPEKTSEKAAAGELPVSENVEIVLKPAEPKPPEAEKTATEENVTEAAAVPEIKPSAAEVPAEAPAEVPKAIAEAVERGAAEDVAAKQPYLLTKNLDKNAYYLQLGAYNEEYAAKGFADTLAGRYPVTVLVGNSKDKVSYKVMVGPLNEDEGGTMLFNFKSEGFKDAFLRKGK